MPTLTAAQRQTLIDDFHNPFSAHPRADFYLRLAQFMDDAYPYPDSPPTEYRAAILWLRGAAEVNSNSGSQSDFIRSYNKAQVEARTGQSLSDAEMDAVSNAVAQEVYDKLMEGPLAEFPTIDVLAENDAAPAAALIFGNNMGGWAGNNLFLALGYSDAFYENIIEAGSSTYDAIAMMKFTAENFSWSNGADAGLQFWNYPAGAATVVAATNALDAFLVAAYGANALMTASQIVASYETILGRIVEADQLHGTEDADLIHGGGGDDTIYGSDGGDLIDGAEGRDVVDYSLVDWGNRFILKDDVQSSAGYVGSVVSTGLFPNDATALFGIEEIRAGDADDEVQLMGLPSPLERIDGGDQGEQGDLLSAFYASQGISFDMESGLLAIGEATLEAVGFERVEGSGHNDFISGDDESNAIKGGYGSDSLFGSGGDDFIFFDAEDGANVNGGAGRDVAVALGQDGVTVNLATQGLEVVLGTGKADTFIMQGDADLMVAGGAGSDTIIANVADGDGPRTIWGGAGEDLVVVQDASYLGIMVANVAGLTEANFHLFDKSMLGLGADFDWSSIDLLLLNPDDGDRIQIDTPDGPSRVLKTGSVETEVYAVIGDSTTEPVQLLVDTLGSFSDLTYGPRSFYDGHVGYFGGSGFVDGYSGSVFTNAQLMVDEYIIYEHRVGDTTYITDQDGDPGDIGLYGDGWNGEYDTIYDLSAAKNSSDWVNIAPGEAIRAHYFLNYVGAPLVGVNANWFILGGNLLGTDINSNGSIFADMTGVTDDRLADWLLAA